MNVQQEPNKIQSYVFREARIADIPSMKTIRDCVRENVLANGKSIDAEEYMQALFQDGKGWVCLHNDNIIGFSCGRLKQKDVWALFIRHDYEGKGIGNRLMELLEAWMFSQGCSEIVLSTDPGTRAERLYKKRGWEFQGKLENNEVKFCLRRSSTDQSAPKELPFLKTERLLLRLPVIENTPEIIRYFKENASHLSPFAPKKPDDFYTEAFWKKRILNHTEDFQADRAVGLYLFNRKCEKEIVGSLEFSQISRGPFQACYLGYGIGRKYQGQGLMFEALQAAIHYVFNDLNLHRIMANHLPDNERSAQLLQRLGFQRECIAKDYLRINGKWRDHVLNSLHNPEWRDGGQT